MAAGAEDAAPSVEMKEGVCFRCGGKGVVFQRPKRKEWKKSGGSGPRPEIEKECSVCGGSGVMVNRKREKLLSRLESGDAKRSRRELPDDWIARGPSPRGGGGDKDLEVGENEELCMLSGKWAIFQPIVGHRYSTDDLVTAWYGWRAMGGVDGSELKICDIGCGIGSVLLFSAWLFPGCKDLVGVEAQKERVDRASRSIRYNGCEDRVKVVRKDLRELGDFGKESFHLVTGTPPYFSPDQLGQPTHSESAACLFERRGGIEAYCNAAAKLLHPEGTFCVVETALAQGRVYVAAESAHLRVRKRLDVIPKVGKPPLFSVFTITKRTETISSPIWQPIQQAGQELASLTDEQLASISKRSKILQIPLRRIDGPIADELVETLTVRDESGNRTPQYKAVLDDMGKPPR